jgi:hypothetical protein
VDENFGHRRNVALRVGALVVLVAALVTAVFVLQGGVGSDQPLNPNDPMSVWRMASHAEKRATAEILLVELQREGTLRPQNRAVLNGPGGLQVFCDELVAALDLATDRNQPAYVSPGEPLARTAAAIAAAKGWDK